MRVHYVQKVALIFIMILNILLLGACNNPKEYTITYDTGTESSIESTSAFAGDAIFAPDDPVRDGYRFDGWYNNDNPFTFSVMPQEDIVLEANWSKFYTIFFDTDGGEAIDSIQIAEGDPINLPDDPEKPHNKFTGWDYNGTDFTLTTMPTGDVLLLATWTEASTITFEAIVYDRYLDENVLIEVDNLVEIAGEPITPPETPIYAEYKFVSWQLDGEPFDFSTMPEDDITLTADWLELSNLPVLFIDLYDHNGYTVPLQNVNRTQYVTSTITLENTASEFHLDGAEALFKGRGNGSWIDSGDKRGYRLKFEDDQSILGFPKSRHWVLLAGANFDDVTMLRNKLSFDMTNEIFTNIEYGSRSEWVDVYINGEYRGVYLIAEHLRVDEDRVDIESEYGELDTGFLIEYDAYASGTNGIDFFRVDGVRYAFSVHSPEPDEYLEDGFTEEQYRQQVTYIQGLVQDMVTAIMTKDFETFDEVADVASFVDMYILHEFFKNIDSGYSSFYIYRNPGGKLTAGPPWDFDATLGSTPSRGNGSPEGIFVALSVQAFSSRTANEMLITLYDTPEFYAVIEARWAELSPTIQTFIDETLTEEMVETYKFAIARNFVRWPTPQGYGTQKTQEECEEDWAMHIERLKDWMTDRRLWLDEEWSSE